MDIPKHPIMLMSFVNTQLRDNYSSLEDFTKSYGIDKEELISKLKSAGYTYNKESNKFINQ